MYCKHCGQKLADGETVCPGCGAEISNASAATPASTHAQELELLLLDANEKKQDAVEETSADADDFLLLQAQEPEQTQIAAPEMIAESAQDTRLDSPEATQNPPANAPEETMELPPVDTQTVIATAPAMPPTGSSAVQPVLPVRESRTARRSRTAVKLIVCLCGVLLAALVAVRMTTHLFDNTNAGLQPVSLNVLTEDEKAEFLDFISAYAPLFGTDFKPKTLGVAAFFELLDLNSANNLYAARFGQPSRITDVPDAAERFGRDDGSYSYYRIEEKDLNAVAAALGVMLPGSANSSDCYYFDGVYYFAADETVPQASSPSPEVAQAKRTEDGNYYMTCTVSGKETVYCLAAYDRDAASASWSLLELSASPMFRDDGTRIADESAALDYEMRQEKIEAKTQDGTLFATYVVDYPYFTDAMNEPALTINALYAQILASYREQAADAERVYQKYLKYEYDLSLLPGYTYVVSSVTYDANGYISLLDELTEYSAVIAARDLKRAQRDDPNSEIVPAGFSFPTVTYSGTTVDTASGAFLRKDDFFTQEHQTYQNVLYRIYAGLDPADETPLTDSEAAVGQQIFSAPWVLTAQGVRFCYLNAAGYYDYVTLPYTYLDGEFASLQIEN